MTARLTAATLRVAAVIVVALVGLGAAAESAPSAGASGTNHALVVVEADGSVVQRVVSFTSDSISGLTALQQAGFGTVVRGFGGMGAAVCAIDLPTTGQTVGCPADNSCLTCAGSTFWAYFEAPAGSASFHQSRAGASSTRVRDGDVEGWRWGTGDPPPYTSVAAVAGPPPSAAPAAAPPPAGARTGSTAPAPSARSAPSTGGPAGPSPPSTLPAVTPTTATAPPSTATPGVSVDARRTSRRASDAPKRGGSGTGSTIGYVVFGVVAAALGTAIVLARRGRRA